MSTQMVSEPMVKASAASNRTGYRSFTLGSFNFGRDEYFVHISWPAKGQTMTHTLPADAFLRAMMRDVAWGFFYGWVNLDDVIGTRNLYGKVELYAGRYYPAYSSKGLDLTETFKTPEIMATFKALLDDWTNEGFDPFAAPDETGKGWLGNKKGHNRGAIERQRQACKRMPGLPGDAQLRTDANGFPVNRAFADVPQNEPEMHAEPGFENEVHAMSLFGYLSRSDVTWNPSVSSVCGRSLCCPTTEEYILPIKHGNDRVEWFIQLSDEIDWVVEDKKTGAPRAKVKMKAGDVAAMPADIRHQGFSRKRSMLLVWGKRDAGAVGDVRHRQTQTLSDRVLTAGGPARTKGTRRPPRELCGIARRLVNPFDFENTGTHDSPRRHVAIAGRGEGHEFSGDRRAAAKECGHHAKGDAGIDSLGPGIQPDGGV